MYSSMRSRFLGRYAGAIPVEGTRENEVVVRGEAAQTGLVLALVDQTAGLVDDD